ncbi:MAG TPA: radical SAM protein [Dissulfurispiraceae bacterium]|nr:radical SAM protein [Dissulfurispiraceae bacterium]
MPQASPSVLLINPPVTKPCEPPAGMAKLSAALRGYGIAHRIIDANVGGLLCLLARPLPSGRGDDAWTARSVRNVEHNLSLLRDFSLYGHRDRYMRAVKDIGRVLARTSPPGIGVGIANYEQNDLSPLRSADLLAAAERPERNPFYPYFRSQIEEVFHDFTPTAAGISLNFLSQALPAFSLIGALRRACPGLTVIVGGGLVTSWLSNPRWTNPFRGLIDHLVAGPGEHRLAGLLGMATRPDEQWRPDYSSLLDNNYLSPGFVLPYSASTGCYWKKCRFCPERSEANPYAPVPAGQVMEDLKKLAEKTSPVLIHFLDNAMSPALLRALAAGGSGIPWYGFCRIDSGLVDPDFCMALRESGCVMLKLGIESGDQGVLDALGKGITAETASRVLKNLKRAGIATYVYLLFGTPAESEEAARNTLAFTVRHCDSIDFLNLAIFNMPVCGDEAEEMETRNFYEGDLSLYREFTHPLGWNRRRVRTFLDREFRRHPAIWPILQNDPPFFTSNHAPFFVMQRHCSSDVQHNPARG